MDKRRGNVRPGRSRGGSTLVQVSPSYTTGRQADSDASHTLRSKACLPARITK